MFLLSTIENRVRQNLKILFFCGRKNILKKIKIFFEIFQTSKNRKSKNVLEFFWTFFGILIFDFFLKKNLFFKNIFRSQKIKIFRRDFF